MTIARAHYTATAGENEDIHKILHQPLAVSLDMVVVDRSLLKTLNGLDASIEWPAISFVDFCLRSSFKNDKLSEGVTIRNLLNVGVISMLVPIAPNKAGLLENANTNSNCYGLSTLPLVGDEEVEQASNYQWYSFDRLLENEARAMRLLTSNHMSSYRLYSFLVRKLSFYDAFQSYLETTNDLQDMSVPSNPLSYIARLEDLEDETRLAWVIHCGGSQGFEAATILQQLDRMVNVRTVIRGFRQCEHADTLSDMPIYFQDKFDSSAYKSFISPYEEPDYASIDASSASLPVNRSGTSATLDAESGEIALYARDYRDLGRWIPDDASYVIGRYIPTICTIFH